MAFWGWQILLTYLQSPWLLIVFIYTTRQKYMNTKINKHIPVSVYFYNDVLCMYLSINHWIVFVCLCGSQSFYRIFLVNVARDETLMWLEMDWRHPWDSITTQEIWNLQRKDQMYAIRSSFHLAGEINKQNKFVVVCRIGLADSLLHSMLHSQI